MLINQRDSCFLLLCADLWLSLIVINVSVMTPPYQSTFQKILLLAKIWGAPGGKQQLVSETVTLKLFRSHLIIQS